MNLTSFYANFSNVQDLSSCDAAHSLLQATITICDHDSNCIEDSRMYVNKSEFVGWFIA